MQTILKGNQLITVLEPEISTGVFQDRILTLLLYNPHSVQPWHSEVIMSYDCSKLEKIFEIFETKIKEEKNAYHSA